MVSVTEQHIFFLDDDSQLHRVVGKILEEAGCKISCFDDAATCIARLRSQSCSLLITDLKMPEIDGIEVLKEVKRLTPWVPVLVISGYGDIPAAVEAMRSGAVDFVEKPLNKEGFLRKVESMLSQAGFPDPSLGRPLTQAETTVLNLVIDGKSSKEIASLLHRSVRTIEGHRSHLMRKLHAENILDLVERAVSMKLIDVLRKPKLQHTAEILEAVRR